MTLAGVSALFVMTIIAYVPALGAGYIWDDNMYVTGNALLRSVGGLWDIWVKVGATPQYYPLVFTTFWIEHQLWGQSAAGYHVVNVLLHAGGAALLWMALRRLAVPGAWLAAAVFALHPVHVESVAWITERKNVLSGVLYLSAFLAYLRFADLDGRMQDGRKEWKHYGVALAFFIGALLSKTVTATLPAALCLALWWKRGRLRWSDVWPLLPMFAIGLGMSAVTAMLERTQVGAAGPDWDLSIVERLLIAGRAIWFYAESLVLPMNLTFIYPRWTIDAGDWWQYLFPLGAAALVLGLIAVRGRLGNGPLVAILFFGGTLLPALGFINIYPMKFSFVADHFQYLASIGIIALLAAGAAVWTRRVPMAIRLTAAGCVLVTLGTATYRQSRIYKNVETLWTDTLAKNDQAWIAHDNLSEWMLHQGKFEKAIEHAKSSLWLRPDNDVPHNNMGLALESLKQFDAALEEYRKAVAAQPRQARARLNMASLLLRLNDTAEAEKQYRLALADAPQFADGHYNFAVFLEGTGRRGEAIEHCREAISLNGNDPDSHAWLGYLLFRDGKRDEAIREIDWALVLDPNHGGAKSLREQILSN